MSGTAKESYDEKLVPCPLCKSVFVFVSCVIEIHANNYMDVMNSVESKVYDDVMFETEPSIEDEDREPDEVPTNKDLVEQNKTQEDANSIWQAIKEAIREISHNVGDLSNRLYARRTTSWKDFVDYHKKWWIKWGKNPHHYFLGAACCR